MSRTAELEKLFSGPAGWSLVIVTATVAAFVIYNKVKTEAKAPIDALKKATDTLLAAPIANTYLAIRDFVNPGVVVNDTQERQDLANYYAEHGWPDEANGQTVTNDMVGNGATGSW